MQEINKYASLKPTYFASFIVALFFSCTLFTSALFSNELQAAEKVDQTIDVEANSFIEIKHVSGSAKIIAWNENKVKIIGELGERTEEFRFERDGNSVIIEVKVKKNNSWNWGKDKDGDRLEIYVPTKSRLEYQSVNASVRVSDIDGEADVQVINGSIRAENLSGRIGLESVNGDIRGTALKGELTVSSVNGEINVQQVEGEEISVGSVNGEIDVVTSAQQISVETVNGEINLTAQDVSDVQATTVNGRIDLDMNLLGNGKVRASSVSGRISLGFQSGVSAKFDIQAHAGGSIKNKLTDDEPIKAKYGPRRSLEFSTGNPTGHVEVSTVSGRIEIRERS